MKVVLFAALAVLSVLGLSCVQGYGYGYPSTSGNSDMLMYGGVLFLFIFLLLFTQTKSVPLFYRNQSLGVNVPVNVVG